MSQSDDFKIVVSQGIREMVKNRSKINSVNLDEYIQIGDSADICSNSEFAQNIKKYIENALSNHLENVLHEIPDIQKMTWKIDAHNIAKDILETSTVSSVRENIDSIVENCVTQICSELNSETTKEPSSENSKQPIQSTVYELTQFISNTKTTNIKAKAYELLISSHYTDTVTRNNWTELQHIIQEGLNDDNMDVFNLCLKLHSKLLSCSSFEIVKDTFINLLESVCKQYNEQKSEYEKISFSNSMQFRLFSIISLIMNAIKVITKNIARFGLKRLEEIIDNLIHLISIHNVSKSTKGKHILSPYEILSCLDPEGSWCIYLTHGVITRNIFLNSCNSSSRNSLLQIIVEELKKWFLKPYIPDKLNDMTEICVYHVNFAVFVHSLSLFSLISKYEMGRAFFPLFINKNEEYVTIPVITEKVITFLNEKVNQGIENNSSFSNSFFNFVSKCAKKLFSIKENQVTLLHVLIRPLQHTPPKLFSHTVEMLKLINQCECDKHSFVKNSTLGRRRGIQVNRISVSAHCFRNKNYKSSSDHLQTLTSENSSSFCVSDILLNILTIILEAKDIEYSVDLVSQLINVFGKHLTQYDGFCSVLNKEKRCNITHPLAIVYRVNEENFKNTSRVETSNLIRACQHFFLKIGTTPLGSYLTKEEELLNSILSECLEAPDISWACSEWRLFLSYCCQYVSVRNVITPQNTNLVKQQLLKLWDIIDTDCSGSDIQIQEAIQNFLLIIASFGFSLNGVSAVFQELPEGSDITITDQMDSRPTNIAMLIQNFALSIDISYDMVLHHLALSVLHIFVSNLDSNLYLQHSLQFQEHLLQLQSDNRIDELSEVIIDECSTLRHTILEQSYFPRHNRTDIKLYFTPPQVTSTLNRMKAKPRFNGEFTKFLQETRSCLHDMNWLKQARKFYRASVHDDFKGMTLLEALDQVKKCLPDVNNGIKWASTEEAEKVNLFHEEVLGIQLVIRYGAHHRLLQPTSQNADNLGNLICLTRASFGSKLDKFSGFDWFLASVFLICSGNIERCQHFLSGFATLPTASYIWPSSNSNDNKDFAVLGQLIESIASNELPCAFYSLQNNGISWWLICLQWIRECFWNTLDWNQVCHWLMMGILQQPEYVIYFCIALLHVNEQYILKLSREGNLYHLVVNPLDRFHMSDIYSFMDRLYKRYHNTLISKMNLHL